MRERIAFLIAPQLEAERRAFELALRDSKRREVDAVTRRRALEDNLDAAIKRIGELETAVQYANAEIDRAVTTIKQMSGQVVA